MKNLPLIMFLPVFLFFLPQGVNSQATTQQTERGKTFLVEYFQETLRNLQKEINNLTPQQLQFKPTEEEWSVSQCLEHIIETEKMLFSMAKELVEKPENPHRRLEVKVTDYEIINGMEDRSNKVKAPAELEPKGRYFNSDTALRDLQDQRIQILAYLETVSPEDLRNHIKDSPYGPVNAYHSMLYIPAHTARHTFQITEIMAHCNFPSN